MPELNPQNSILDPGTNAPKSIFAGNKGLIIAMAIVFVVAIMGIVVFIGSNGNEGYQGMINKVKMETEAMKGGK